MKTYGWKIILVSLLTTLLCLTAFEQTISGQLDPPHDSGVDFTAGCTTCHDMVAFDQPNLIPNDSFVPDPGNIDWTLYNSICWNCHTGVDAAYVETHSSRQVGYNDHGDWTVECWVCHNQHTQEQNRDNGSTYGKFVRNRIDLTNILDNAPPMGATVAGKSGLKNVIFKGNNGPDSFAIGDATDSGICEVCHTLTDHWSKSALDAGNKHFSSLNCIQCHPHDKGMKAAPPDHAALVPVPSFCQSCHPDTVFGLHNSTEVNWVNCERCHDKANSYALNGVLPLYLGSKLSWDIPKDKEALTSGQARCDDCHQGQYHEHITDTGHGRLHNNIILGYDSDDNGVGDQILDCDACHYSDAIQEHVTRREFSCSVCHDRAEIGLPAVAAITSTIADGRAGTQVFCDDCHDDDHFLTDAGTSLVKEHHYSKYAMKGNCRKCHIVGPGTSGPKRPPCYTCHGQGKPRDPQRAGTDKHDQGPSFTGNTVEDFRACFSCHLDGGPGFISGLTPPVPGLLHPMPTGTVYFPTGYQKDGSNNWVDPSVLIPSSVLSPSNARPVIPTDLEFDPAVWQGWPGYGTIRLKAKDYRAYAQKYRYPDPGPVNDWVFEQPDAVDSTPEGEDYWGIRTQTGTLDFLMRDYPTVEVTYNGDTQYLPSYDGTGDGGQPTGEGSLTVDISDAAAVGSGALWRVDGSTWQVSGATVSGLTARNSHLVEFKPLAGWDEPDSVEVSIADLQTTTLSGAPATYSTCPGNTQLSIVRDAGGTTFNWTLPEQVETFTVNSIWKNGPVVCELWLDNSGSLVEPTGFSTRTADDGNGCEVYKDDFTPAGVYNLVLQTRGSNCFRNNDDIFLTVNVTAAGEPSPYGQAGGIINETEIDSLDLPSTSRGDFINLSGNLYVHVSREGILYTFTIDTLGNISPVLDTDDIWNNQLGSTARLVKVSNNLIAVTYNGNPGSDMASYIITVRIEQDGTITGIRDTYNFHAGYWSLEPIIFPHNVADLFIVSWRADDVNGGSPQYRAVMTVQIDSNGTITEKDRETSYTNLSDSSDIVHMTGNYYAFMNGSNLKTLSIDAEGIITNPLVDEYQFASSNGYGEMIRLSKNIVAVSYSTDANDPGYLKTLAIDDYGRITKRAINSFMFEPCSTGHYSGPYISRITKNIVGVYYYEYTGCTNGTGVALKTIAIDDEGRMQTPVLVDTMKILGYNCKHPRLIPVSDNVIAMSLTETAPSRTFFGIKTFGISSDNDYDGITSDSDNCPEVANASQVDSDGDGVGDACDMCQGFDDSIDADGDGIGDPCDTCPGFNDLADADSDGQPDDCDICPNDPLNDGADGDGICEGSGYYSPMDGDKDNCPNVANPDQLDSDCDGFGDACGPDTYYSPGSYTGVVLSSTETGFSWNDIMTGEDGYRIERKAESCIDSALAFAPVATIFEEDTFDSKIDTAGWLMGAAVQGAGSTNPPVVSNGSGSAEVSWEDGAVKLHTVANDMGDTGYNSSYIEVKNASSIIGGSDFDIQFNYSLPLGSLSTTEYHVYARLQVLFPATTGGSNSLYLERRFNDLDFIGMTVDGIAEYGSAVNTDFTGKLRLVRSDRQLSAYAWSGNTWKPLLRHSTLQPAELAPTQVRIVQYTRRNEPGGQDITALVDNFKFNTVGGRPVPKLDMHLDENSWIGLTGEVKDSAAGANHATAYGDAMTVVDSERGIVGSFDAHDDYVSIPGDGTLENVTDSSFTFSAWAKPASVPPASGTDSYNDYHYGILSRPGNHTELMYSRWKQFNFEVWNSDATPQYFGIASPATYEPGEWHHVVGVVDVNSNPKTVKLYVDGALVNSRNDFTGSLFEYNTQSYFIGAGRIDIDYKFWFHGNIDDPQIFDRALSADEVADLFYQTSEFKDSGLSADTPYCYRVYPFKADECSNWFNHASEVGIQTQTLLAGNATTVGTPTAFAIRGGSSLYINMPFYADNNSDNTYTVEYKLSSSGTWTTFISGAPHTASPYTTIINGLTMLENYDVRVTYTDPDGVTGTAQQIMSDILITPARSCKQILDHGYSTGDGIYWIDPDGESGIAPFQAYCDMTSDGGGWTLVMKLDGSQNTFMYSSGYWTTSQTLNTGSLGFDTTQAKFQSYNNLGFTSVRLGMRDYGNPADDIDWIEVNITADSLYSLIGSGSYTATSVGRTNWLNLLEGISTQPNCNKEGFNSEQQYSKMRLGFAMNGENDCLSCDRILGFGNQTTGHPWGAWAAVGGGYPGTNTVAYGWIMVR